MNYGSPHFPNEAVQGVHPRIAWVPTGLPFEALGYVILDLPTLGLVATESVSREDAILSPDVHTPFWEAFYRAIDRLRAGTDDLILAGSGCQ